MSTSKHSDLILDQFTRQAVPFATAPSIKDESALKLIVEFSGAGPSDTVLDVACGPGLVVCAFALVARQATGIDITPAMNERARSTAAAQGLTNVTWRQGDVLPLPWPDASFTVVTSRFAFHHFLEPGAVLREMARVCRPGGTVMVVDSAPAPDKADAFNRMEVVRDPSHARALPLSEHLELFRRLSPGVPVTQHPRDLSEGQRLTLALAVVLAGRPPLLLLDEPTRGLDYTAKHRLVEILRDLAEQGHAVLLATHDVELVAEVATRVLVMAEGELVADGPTADVVVSSPAFAPQVAKVLAPQRWLTPTQVAVALAGTEAVTP